MSDIKDENDKNPNQKEQGKKQIDPKLAKEQLEKLMQLESLLKSKMGNGPTDNQSGQNNASSAFDGEQKKEEKSKVSLRERIRNFSFKNLLLWVAKRMDNMLIYIDQLIGLVTGNREKINNDLLSNARRPILFGISVITIFVVFGGIWVFLAPLDSAAVAIGFVISDSKKRIINHPEGGILYKLHVKLGDEVKVGDPLMELDYVRIKADYDASLSQYRTLLASEARLLAEINKLDKVSYPQILLEYISDPVVNKLINTQNELFSAAKTLQDAEIDALKQKIKQLNTQIVGLESKKKSLKKAIELTSKRVDAAKKLSKDGFVHEDELLDREMRHSSTISELAVAESEIARVKEDVIKTNIELLGMESRINDKNLRELKDTQMNLSQAREKYLQTKDRLDRAVIKSPVDGIVNTINFFTVGSVIPSTQPIMEISPLNDKLIIEAKIPPKNIDSVSVGLNAKIRFSAFKSRTTPVFNGKLISLSPDVVIDSNMAARGDPMGGAHYLAKIVIDEEQFNEVARTRKIKLHPGMQAEVQIVTGTRTLIKYLLDPVLDAMFKGLKEK